MHPFISIFRLRRSVGWQMGDWTGLLGGGRRKLVDMEGVVERGGADED
jgi:hypothetical protein